MSETEPSEDYSTPVLPGAGASDYERYLRTDELLALQKTPEEWVHRDELLFQTVHQSSELWLKLASTEVEEAARLFDADAGLGGGAADPPRRDGARLRDDVARDARADVAVGVPGDPRRARPRQRLRLARLPRRRGGDAPAPGRAFTALVGRAGLELVELYQRGREFEDLYQAAEALTDWDERIWVWRFRHYAVVARSLGEDTKGTQGTPVQVLGKLIAQRQLPELWKARAALVEALRRRAHELAAVAARGQAARRRRSSPTKRSTSSGVL